jgi:hypothetical protein
MMLINGISEEETIEAFITKNSLWKRLDLIFKKEIDKLRKKNKNEGAKEVGAPTEKPKEKEKGKEKNKKK